MLPFYVRPGTNDRHAFNESFSNVYHIDGTFTPSDVILDIGAHIGSFSRYMYDIHNCKKITAYEPDKQNFEILCKNTESTSITACNSAVYSEVKELFFSGVVEDPSKEVVHSHHSIYLSGPKDTKVLSIKFDDLVPETGIRLLKLDCEGCEYPILYKSSKLNLIQEIVMEYHNFISEEFEANGDSIAKFLKENGFTIKKQEHLGYLNLVSEVGYIKAVRD